jgi:hypothetical protein
MGFLTQLRRTDVKFYLGAFSCSLSADERTGRWQPAWRNVPACVVGGECDRGDDVSWFERWEVCEQFLGRIAFSEARDNRAKRDARAGENAFTGHDLRIAVEVLEVVHGEKYSARRRSERNGNRKDANRSFAKLRVKRRATMGDHF